MSSTSSNRLALTCGALLLGALAGARDDPAAVDAPAEPPADTTLVGEQVRATRDIVKRNAQHMADALREGKQQAATTAKGVAKDVAGGARNVAGSAKQGAEQVAASTVQSAQQVKSTVRGAKTSAAPAPDKSPPAPEPPASPE